MFQIWLHHTLNIALRRPVWTVQPKWQWQDSNLRPSNVRRSYPRQPFRRSNQLSYTAVDRQGFGESSLYRCKPTDILSYFSDRRYNPEIRSYIYGQVDRDGLEPSTSGLPQRSDSRSYNRLPPLRDQLSYLSFYASNDHSSKALLS